MAVVPDFPIDFAEPVIKFHFATALVWRLTADITSPEYQPVKRTDHSIIKTCWWSSDLRLKTFEKRTRERKRERERGRERERESD